VQLGESIGLLVEGGMVENVEQLGVYVGESKDSNCFHFDLLLFSNIYQITRKSFVSLEPKITAHCSEPTCHSTLVLIAVLMGIRPLPQHQRAVAFRLEPLLCSHHQRAGQPWTGPTGSPADPLFDGNSTGGFGGFGAALTPASQKDTAGGGGFSFG
jgi:hypothetical protein